MCPEGGCFNGVSLYVVCTLLIIMKFGLDKSTRRRVDINSGPKDQGPGD